MGSSSHEYQCEHNITHYTLHTSTVEMLSSHQTVCCLLSVSALLTACQTYSPPSAWRPQGRFGKRTAEEDPVLSLTTGDDGWNRRLSRRGGWRPQGRMGKRSPHDLPADDVSEPLLSAIPVELFYSLRDLTSSDFRPQMCSILGVEGYPVCPHRHEGSRLWKSVPERKPTLK